MCVCVYVLKRVGYISVDLVHRFKKVHQRYIMPWFEEAYGCGCVGGGAVVARMLTLLAGYDGVG